PTHHSSSSSSLSFSSSPPPVLIHLSSTNIPIPIFFTSFFLSVYIYTHTYTYIHIYIYMGDKNSNNVNQLPPGFRFYPTDEELVVHFLHRKAALLPCHPDVIPDLDLYPYDPWELDGKAMGEGNKWYFFSRKTQNRITRNGYWQPLGVDEAIYSSSSSTVGKKVGTKKLYAFYVGEAPAGGVKTNWVMQEYRLSESGSSSSTGSSSRRRPNPKVDYSKWVLCRAHERNCDDDDNDGMELSCLDEIFLSLDDLEEISFPN
ncbi:hypothetical protein U1Q18_035375, partial [Sarracenia purpurea var. burkii]